MVISGQFDLEGGRFGLFNENSWLLTTFETKLITFKVKLTNRNQPVTITGGNVNIKRMKKFDFP